MSVLLNKNKYFSITKKEGDKIYFNSSNGEKLTSSNVGGEVTHNTIGIADEQIELFNGKILKRIRNNLIIE